VLVLGGAVAAGAAAREGLRILPPLLEGCHQQHAGPDVRRESAEKHQARNAEGACARGLPLPRRAADSQRGHASYTAQVLAKSCKLIPVMLMGTVLYGKRYAVTEYLAALLIAGACQRTMCAHARQR
jgi:hypothetical protein